MASSPAAAQLTEGHRLAQAQLGAQTVRLLRSTWPLLDPADLDGTVARWLRVSVPLVAREARLSARLAAQYLTAFRALEVSVGGYMPTLDDLVDIRAVTTSLTVTGPVSIKEQLRRGVPLVRALTVAEAASAGAGMRHALSGGRGTLLRSIRADRTALGWARVTSGDPCHFCARLASRGPVYGEDTGSFQAHDSCACTAEPVYSRDADWPAGGRHYEQMWKDAKEMDGDTAINFRRLVEGRVPA